MRIVRRRCIMMGWLAWPAVFGGLEPAAAQPSRQAAASLARQRFARLAQACAAACARQARAGDRAPGVSPPPKLSRQQQIAADFAAGRTIIVAGWVLSRTEAALYAELAPIDPKAH